MREEPQPRGFSITNLLTQNEQLETATAKPEKENTKSVEKEENSSTRTSSTTSTSSGTSPMSPSDPTPSKELIGMLGFNPMFMQQMAQSAAAAFAFNSTPQPKQPPKHSPVVPPAAVNPMVRMDPNQQPQLEVPVPTTSTNMFPQQGTPEWFNTINYLNLASRQFQFMSGGHPSKLMGGFMAKLDYQFFF